MEKPKTPSLSPKDRQIVHQIFEILEGAIQIPRYNNAASVTLLLTQILEKLKHSDLSEMEELLRETGSRVYLIAVPPEIFGAGLKVRFRHGELTPQFALYVCMNGADEARETLDQYGVSSEENRQNLKNCGFLCL